MTMEHNNSQVKDLPKWDRIKFHRDLITELENTAYPDSYNRDKELVIESLTERIDQIIRGEA